MARRHLEFRSKWSVALNLPEQEDDSEINCAPIDSGSDLSNGESEFVSDPENESDSELPL